MKGLPLILTMALLGVNTPFNALPPKPVTVIEDAAAWDAMFSPEAMENVTYTQTTVIDGDEGYEMTSATLRDGFLQEFRYGGEEGFGMKEEYLPEQGLLLTCSFDEEGDSFSYSALAPEGWDAMSSFYLEDLYAGRFEEAAYDKENGCYVLTDEDTTAAIYAEDGRLVKLVDSMTIGSAVYTTESLFTDYGTTVIEPMPEITASVDAETWAAAFSEDGLKNHMIDTFGSNASGEYSTYLSIGDGIASLDYYGGLDGDDPFGAVETYSYESAEEGVYTFVETDYGWDVTSLDREISWEDALLKVTGLGGFADAFDYAVFDETLGCYTLTLNRLDASVEYTVYFVNGELSLITAEAEGASCTMMFSSAADMSWLASYAPFNAVG